MIATQPGSLHPVRTLKPFELGVSSRESLGAASPHHLGCVDWYLYPVGRKAGQTGVSLRAPRGAGATTSHENHPA